MIKYKLQYPNYSQSVGLNFMKYYFGTSEENKGNQEYEKRNYKEALKQYQAAQAKLAKMALQKNFKQDEHYQDALAFVLGEIIITTAEIVLDYSETELNHEKILEKWKPILSWCNEMDSIYKQICLNQELTTNKERINTVYQALSNACKEISNRFTHSIKETAEHEEAITQALDWFSKAEEYMSKANDLVEIELYLGSLELLERGFNYSKNPQFIKRIKSFITENLLDQSKFLSGEQKLQLLYYKFFAATNNKDEDVPELEKQYKELIRKSRKLDKKNPFISKFNQLIANISSEKEEISQQNHKLLCSEIEELTEIGHNDAKKSNRAKKVKRSSRELGDEESAANQKDIQKKVWKAKKVTRQVKKGATSNQEDSWMVDALSELSQALSHDSDFNRLLEASVEPPSKYIKSSETDKNKTSLSPTPFTFFTSPPQLLTSSSTLLQTHHHDAFKKVIIGVARDYKSSGFLANLLSLMGDFYLKSCSLLPVEDNSLRAASFYEAALKLNAEHPVALNRLQEISKNHDDFTYVPANGEIISPENIMSVFSQAIENNMIQIQQVVRVNADAGQIEKLFDDLTDFIANAIRTKELAGSKSQPIAELITTKYELALTKYELALTKVPTLDSENSFLI